MALSALVVVGDRTDGHHGTVRFASTSCGGYNSTSTPVLRVAADQHPDLLALVVVDDMDGHHGTVRFASASCVVATIALPLL
jgi:hypothetical protein